jgi:serine protease
VSGIIAAVADNGLGIAGIAPRVRILPIKVFNANGSGATLSAIADAIRWAAGLEVEAVTMNPQPADIINLSLGGLGNFETLNEVVEEVFDSGRLVIAAAGNDGADTGLRSPANAPLAVAVGSVGLDLTRSSFSNYNAMGGKTVDFVAPGEDIFSSLPDDGSYVSDAPPYGFLTGTSMAAPVVSAVAALMWSYFPELDNRSILDLMRQHSYFDPLTMTAEQVGAGLVRVDGALGFPAPGDLVTVRAQGEFFTFLSDTTVRLDPYGFSTDFVLTDLIVDDYSVQAFSFALHSLQGEDRGRAVPEGIELLIPLTP